MMAIMTLSTAEPVYHVFICCIAVTAGIGGWCVGIGLELFRRCP